MRINGTFQQKQSPPSVYAEIHGVKNKSLPRNNNQKKGAVSADVMKGFGCTGSQVAHSPDVQ